MTSPKNPKSNQLYITILPRRKTKKRLRGDIDILKLTMVSIEGNTQDVFMTPDEACAMASVLSESVQAWLSLYYKPYKKDFMSKKVKKK